MPKTVAEVLKESGLTDEQIQGIDAKAMEGLTRIVSSANEDREKAEFALRAQRQEYDERIAPALASWTDRDTALSTELAAHKAFIQKIKDSGYVPAELFNALPGTPTATPTPGAPRGNDGKFVAGANPSPGSPGFVDTSKISAELGQAFSFLADTTWKYRTLYGQEMPDSPTALIREATANRMSPADWAAKKYAFATKEQEIVQAKQKAHDDSIRKETEERLNKEWSEKIGNNPNVRIPQESQFASVNKAVAEGKRQDPLKMTPEKRKANTHATIQKEFAERSSMVQ
jgi:hypothetical protein